MRGIDCELLQNKKEDVFLVLNEYSFWCFGEFFICSNVDVSGAIVRCLEDIGFREVTNNCSVHRERRSSRISRVLLTTLYLSNEAGKGL